MKFRNEQANIYIPDGAGVSEEFERTTALCIAAHQDDCEIMAYSPISQCFGMKDKWFAAVILTDGSGAPRSGKYEDYTNEQIHADRSAEQLKAAQIGRYSFAAQLEYSSESVRNTKDALGDIAALIERCAPEEVYTHNLADKHETHLAVCLRVIEAIRGLPQDKRPKKLYGLEVWRSLDWLCDSDKIIMDTSAKPRLARALIAAYATQCTPKKRFDLAALGRRLANATFYAPRECDETASSSFGMDMTALMLDDSLSPYAYIHGHISRFREEVADAIEKLQ